MEKHTCKLCSRRFPNGRALGGHMRSHVPSSATQQPPVLKRQLLHPSAGSSASSASTSSAERPAVMADAPVAEEGGRGQEDVKGTPGASYRLRENPRKSSRLVDPEFAFLAAADGEPSGSVVQDRESETEAPAASGHRRRSKRPRRTSFGPPPSPPESGGPASSASCTTTEEDLAICLMMLSRGFWTTESEPKEVDDEENDVDGGVSGGRLRPEKRRSRHQCGTCKKVFRSYQALGGHRASHKKSGGGCVPVLGVGRTIHGDCGDDAGDKVHECPFCFRVFTSGQALGGHKRSHLMYSTGATTTINSQVPAPAQPCSPTSTSPDTSSSGAKCDKGVGLFDLNLPAPVDDDMDFSAVFDPVLAVE